MRYWSIVLHFYQPPTQEKEITKEVLGSCYLPLLRMLSKKSGFGLTFNISASLLLQLKKLEENEFFDLVKQLIREGKVEIVNSVMYHPLIPLTAKDVVLRQIAENKQVLKNLLGVEKTYGFFPPELAINKESFDLIKSDYVVVDESILKKKLTIPMSILKYGQINLLVNNRQICELMRSYPKQLLAKTVMNAVREKSAEDDLLVTANDAELFGHHYSERLQVLSDLLDTKEITFIKSSEAVTRFVDQATLITDVSASTWQDCKGFSLWNNTPLQKKYLKLLKTVYELTSGRLDKETKDFLDQAHSSCYLYWLSNWPWWHPGLVESGAENLMRCIQAAKIDRKKKIEGEAAYHKFLKEMWTYQGSGRVEENYQRYNETKNRYINLEQEG